MNGVLGNVVYSEDIDITVHCMLVHRFSLSLGSLLVVYYVQIERR